MSKKDFTRAMLGQFTREWTDGKATEKRIRDFAKKENLTVRQVLWICVHSASNNLSYGYLDEYLVEWKKANRESIERLANESL